MKGHVRLTSCRREADHDDERSGAVRDNRAVRRSLIGLSTLALTVAGCAALTMLSGQIGTALALRARPGPLLRNE